MASISQGFAQSQKMAQNMVLAPQLRQSLKILQSSALELQSVIAEELEVNPTLDDSPIDSVSIEEPLADQKTNDENDDGNESSSSDEASEEFEILRQLDEDSREFYRESNNTNNYDSEDERRRQHFLDSLIGETSLQQHLMEQAELSGLDAQGLQAMEYLIGSLDNKGFLTSPLSDLSLHSNLPLRSLQDALAQLQSFDPPGIGARDLQECLLLQLRNHHPEESLPVRLVRDTFDLLMRRRIPEIARRLQCSVDDVQETLEKIAECDPAPGRRFSDDENRSVTADVTVEYEKGEFNVTLNNDFIPRLRISSTYKEMLARGRLKGIEREFIREKIRSGKFLISSIEQRQQTLERITWVIIRYQEDFFKEGVSKLRPLTMTQVAQEVGVHETTVSRAIANKYIRTPHGLFEMKYFFTPGYQGEDGSAVSNKSIKDMISALIEREPPEKPLSDQKIVNRLKEKNITIARRTVAKYRESMGILPAKLRRQY
ncbi:MAG: RNA polymerase factor sigma-54 [Opitutales bacterium]|nr:RNA polymerase factor sigma-54 [Opitutales bacterium]MCH8539540.1 RNA polymerase factor sigma-54 [Opitutales bacterium]